MKLSATRIVLVSGYVDLLKIAKQYNIQQIAKGDGNVKSIRIGRVRLDAYKITMAVCTVVVLLAQISEKYHSSEAMMLGYLIALLTAFASDECMLMSMNLFFLSDNSLLDIGGISIQLVIMCIYLVRFSIFKEE